MMQVGPENCVHEKGREEGHHNLPSPQTGRVPTRGILSRVESRRLMSVAPQRGDAQRCSARRRWQPSELAKGHTSSMRHSPVYCSKSTNRAGVGKCAPVSQCPHVLTETPSSLAAVLIFIFRSVRQRLRALHSQNRRKGYRCTAMGGMVAAAPPTSRHAALRSPHAHRTHPCGADAGSPPHSTPRRWSASRGRRARRFHRAPRD